jgi:predicted XRE-type DNA-binding protein
MGDHVVDALDQLVAALHRNNDRIQRAVTKAAALRMRRENGESWNEILSAEERPLVIELIGQNLDELYTAGGRLRRSLARALYDEGLSMEQIARMFGVTRQRVSALLRSPTPQIVDGGESL